ncbi:MAG TPA: hypothetical protein VFE58_20010 [Tepidisphaeraceae bacterium]|jgi:hypothetical protein|nr:hypothetical protein [Tepidisphaeraceae bacterium]
MNDKLSPSVIYRAILAAVVSIGGLQALGQDASSPEKVTVTLSTDDKAPDLAPQFLGVSYETREILPKEGKYYFDPNDENLVRLYETLGIKSLRIGANAVDDPKVDVPDEKAIDAVFTFARKIGAKVIYSFRLKDGDPAKAAKLAAYINKNYSDCLDCFSIGNEPNFYLKEYSAFEAVWKPEYDAILKAVPSALFDGPATSSKNYSLEFADEFFPTGHLKMVSTHTYPLGNGRDAEKNPPAARSKFVENAVVRHYQSTYDNIVKPLADKGIAYRMDETNSCYRGGAENCSDAYASTLWGLDYLNWWAAHHILGLNFHTGDTVNGIPPMKANYAVFVHEPDNKTFEIRPVSYAMLAFSQIAHGKALDVKTDAPKGLNFTAYAYDDGAAGKYIALLNKSYGESKKDVTVSLSFPTDTTAGQWESMTLDQKDSDIAAKTDVELGGSAIDPAGHWDGKWTNLPHGDGTSLAISIKPASAVLLRFSKAH